MKMILSLFCSVLFSLGHAHMYYDMESSVYYFPFHKNAPDAHTVVNETYVDFLLGHITSDGSSCTPYWDGTVLVTERKAPNYTMGLSSTPFNWQSVRNYFQVLFAQNETADTTTDSGKLNQDMLALEGLKEQADDFIFQVIKILKENDNIGITFGGYKDKDLVNTCKTPEELAGAITKVLDVYNVSEIDFNMDDSLMTKENMDKLFEALKILKKVNKTEYLAVSLAIPLEKDKGVHSKVLESMKSYKTNNEHVDYFMLKLYDFGTNEYELIDDTVDFASDQINEFVDLDDPYESIGFILMNGQTHEKGNEMSTDLCDELVDLAKDNNVGRVYLYSLNRDFACPKEVDQTVFNESCSGVKQNSYEFSEIVENFLINRTNDEHVTEGASRPYSSCLLVVAITIVLFFSY